MEYQPSFFYFSRLQDLEGFLPARPAGQPRESRSDGLQLWQRRCRGADLPAARPAREGQGVRRTRRQDRRGRDGQDVAAREAVLLLAAGRRRCGRRRQGSDRRLSLLLRRWYPGETATNRPGRRSSTPSSSGRNGRWPRPRGVPGLLADQLARRWPCHGLHVERPDLAACQLAGHDRHGTDPPRDPRPQRRRLAAQERQHLWDAVLLIHQGPVPNQESVSLDRRVLQRRNRRSGRPPSGITTIRHGWTS